MKREPCPRCGSERPTLGPCPECGYEDPHPGVLGSYRQAIGEIVAEPKLLVPFLFPTLLLFGLRGLIFVGGGFGQASDLVEGLADVLTLYLGMSWYFAAIGSVTTRPGGGPEMPAGPVYVASGIGAAFVAAPITGFVLLVGLQGPGNLGAIGLVATILLLLSSLVAAGRSIGLPVEAAISDTWSWPTLKHANERGRENGGLGLVFLAVLMLIPLVIVPALTPLVAPEPWAGYAQLVVSFIGLTFVGAWTGLAAAIGLSGGDGGIQEEFTCPRCGKQAHAQAGRARCECGLEGPYYPGARS